MSLTFEATYEDGVLKPLTPVPFKEHEKVTIIVDDEVQKRLERVRATAGLIGWKGDAATLERVLREAEETQFE